jgi:hypothetical protein
MGHEDIKVSPLPDINASCTIARTENILRSLSGDKCKPLNTLASRLCFWIPHRFHPSKLYPRAFLASFHLRCACTCHVGIFLMLSYDYQRKEVISNFPETAQSRK